MEIVEDTRNRESSGVADNIQSTRKLLANRETRHAEIRFDRFGRIFLKISIDSRL